MDAVRVPPSAGSVSQSTVTCTSPSATRSVTAQRAGDEPLNLLGPPGLLALGRLAARRGPGVDPGSMEHPAVPEPRPVPRIQGGTRSSTDAVQSTLVCPNVTSTDPGAMTV